MTAADKGKPVRTLEASREFLERLHREAIAPNVEIIVPIIVKGEIAVLVHELADEAKPSLVALGWDGSAPAFRLRSGKAQRFAENLRAIGDHVTARWLTGRRPGRILVFSGVGSLLVNFDQASGFSLEPGSNDDGWMS